MVDDKLHLICQKCGKLRPKKAFKANYKARICNKCFEPAAEATTDLAKHIQGLYEKKKPANR
jgi:hypothetical protein